MQAVSRLTGWILRTLAGTSMAVLILVVVVAVIYRYVLGSPLRWTEEFARYMMVAMAYLAAPLALRSGRHVRITLVVERLRGPWLLAAQLASHCAVASFAAVVAFHGWRLSQMVMFQLSPSLRLPMGIPYMAVAVGGFFICLEAVLLFIRDAGAFLRCLADRESWDKVVPDPGYEDIG